MFSALNKNKPGIIIQFAFSAAAIIAIALVSFIFFGETDYHTVALLLLLTVSLIALVFDFAPVVTAAIISALILNFFFIPPRFTFHIYKSEDILMFLMYFVVAPASALLTTTLRRAEKKAQLRKEELRLKEYFNIALTNLSQKLIGPTESLIATSHQLNNDINNKTVQDNKGLANSILNQSIALNDQVSNMMAISLIESGTLTPKNEWTDIAEIVHKIVLNFTKRGFSQQFDIQIPEHIPFLFSDSRLCEKIIYNLLLNAVLYTPGNSKVSVSCQAIIDHFQIVITDDGPGYPDLKLFENPGKVYRLCRDESGPVHLGLPVVTGIVTALNGRIKFDNNKEGGAMINIEIPAKFCYSKIMPEEKI